MHLFFIGNMVKLKYSVKQILLYRADNVHVYIKFKTRMYFNETRIYRQNEILSRKRI